MGALGLWSVIVALSSLTPVSSLPEQDPSAASELGAPETTAASFDFEPNLPAPPRLFAASLDTSEVLSVASMKAQVRCIRTSMEEDDLASVMESAPFTRSPRPFRRALDDAELAAPPDPPRYLRLTLDD